MLRRVLLALCALALASVQAHAQFLPGRAPGFRPGFQFLNSWVAPGSVYDADLVQGLYTAGPPSISRASPGYAADSAGAYALFGNDTLRRTNVGLTTEPADTNWVRNNSGTGFAAGNPGSFGTNWDQFISNGGTIARQSIALGTEGGVDYVELRYAGTSSAAGGLNIYFETLTGIPASSGQSVIVGLFQRLSAGSTSGITSQGFALDENTSSGSYVAGGNLISVVAPTGAALTSQRVQATRTLSGGATVAAVRPMYKVIWGASASLDFTIRLGWPGLSQGSRLLSPIRTTSGAATRAADAVTLPVAGVGRAVITYDDGSTQTFSGIPTGTPWTIPAANLNRSVIRRITGYAS